MNDITILHYSSSIISESFGKKIRDHLLETTQGKYPIISITQKPLDFGENICVGEIGKSCYNAYKQIYIGTKAAKTKYICCCEDDSLYVPEYFEYQPPDDTFCYNINHLGVDKNHGFIFRNRMNMCNCVAPTKLMIETLDIRHQKYPTAESMDGMEHGFCEPGRWEAYFGLPFVKRLGFKTEIPNLTWNHRPSLGGVRKLLSNHKVFPTHPYWGDGKELWKKFYS